MKAEIMNWNAQGRRPVAEILSVRAYPRATEINIGEDELVSQTDHYQFVLNWHNEMLLR